jgi:plastocyanin
MFRMRIALAAALLVTSPFWPWRFTACAQETLARAPGLDGGWVGYAGELHLNLGSLFSSAGDGIGPVQATPTIESALGLPLGTLVGARFAPHSPVVPGRPDEWEGFARLAGDIPAGAEPIDFALGAAFNGAARSFDGQASGARWFGPLRLMAEGRVMTRAFGESRTRGAIAAGAVLHPLEGRAPLALTGSIASLLDPDDGERIAWSAGVQLGVSFTPHTLSVFATNASTHTIQGLSRGDGTLRLGFQLTVPVPAGRFLGWYVPRPVAAEAVATDVETEPTVVAEIRRYLYAPREIEVRAGTTIEWVNLDDMMHTVSADDGSWNSGPIETGERWRATFSEPGRYPYHCGPHPFMRAVVVVR